jgi:hypothetical protein
VEKADNGLKVRVDEMVIREKRAESLIALHGIPDFGYR